MWSTLATDLRPWTVVVNRAARGDQYLRTLSLSEHSVYALVLTASLFVVMSHIALILGADAALYPYSFTVGRRMFPSDDAYIYVTSIPSESSRPRFHGTLLAVLAEDSER